MAHRDGKYNIDLKAFEAATKEEQLQEMEAWFRAHFEDPAQDTPYMSSEGGYLYINGGPYEAGEELYHKFGDYVSEEVLLQLTDELEGECWEWAPTYTPEDYYPDDEGPDYGLYYDLPANVRKFKDGISEVKMLLGDTVSNRQCLLKLLHAHLITIFEAYLCDTFIGRILQKEDLFWRYIDEHQLLADVTIGVSDLRSLAKKPEELKDYPSRVLEALKEKAISGLKRQNWHNFRDVAKLYKRILGVTFPGTHDSTLKRAVEIRHHIIHRNGETPEGKIIEVSEEDIQELMAAIEATVDSIENSSSPF